MAGRLILASASPRRLDLLAQVGITPAAVVPAAVARDHGGDFVLAADTVVACGRRSLPKPADAAEARDCLGLLSGRRHRVIGAVALACPGGRTLCRVAVTAVRFKRLGRAEIDRYLATDEWRDKAGGYAIQGRAALFVTALNGDYNNVVGLPLAMTAALLAGAGAWSPTTEA